MTLIAGLSLAAEPSTPPRPAEDRQHDDCFGPGSCAWTAGFDRVDLLSEEPATFLNNDLPYFMTDPTVKVVRLVEQVKVVFRLPWQGLYAGASITSQSLTYEYPLFSGLSLTGTLQTRLLFPSGANLGVAYRMGILRLGLSVSMTTSGSWAAPGLFVPQFLPALGIGLGPTR